MSGRFAGVPGALTVALPVAACALCSTKRLPVWQALAVGAVGALCGILWLTARLRHALAQRAPAQAAAAVWLDALVAGEFEAASGMLGEERRERTGPAQVAERYAGDRALAAYSIDGTTIVGGGGLRAETRGQVRFANGQAAPMLVLLTEVAGRWRVADWYTGDPG